MCVRSESIEWELPKAARDFVRRTCRFLLFAPVLITIITVFDVLRMDIREWVRFGSVAGFLILGVALSWWLRRQYVAVMRRKFRVDTDGVHQLPGVSVGWAKVASVAVKDGGVAGTRVLQIRTDDGTEQGLPFDPALVDEGHLLSYASAHLAM